MSKSVAIIKIIITIMRQQEKYFHTIFSKRVWFCNLINNTKQYVKKQMFQVKIICEGERYVHFLHSYFLPFFIKKIIFD